MKTRLPLMSAQLLMPGIGPDNRVVGAGGEGEQRAHVAGQRLALVGAHLGVGPLAHHEQVVGRQRNDRRIEAALPHLQQGLGQRLAQRQLDIDTRLQPIWGARACGTMPTTLVGAVDSIEIFSAQAGAIQTAARTLAAAIPSPISKT